MSLLPYLFCDDDADVWRPPRQHRHFGFVNDDILQPLAISRALMQSPDFLRSLRNLNAAFRQDSAEGALVNVDKDKFQASFDVQHFKPEEISVKVTGDNTITIEGKHEEKQDEHGQIYRHFVRRYVLPKNCDVGRVESKLSSDGVLTISAPTAGEKVEHRTIPISQTGKPAKSVEAKEKEEKMETEAIKSK